MKTVVDNRTVGEILSEARIARDMDYAEVAAQLRIRRTYIEAIEDGRLGDLPGSTYAIGFVRTYAELLDLDVPKIVAKFKQEAAEFEDRTQLVFPEPMPGSRGPTASVIVIAILMLAGAYGGWLYVSNKDRDTIELVPPLPESLSRLLSQSTGSEAPEQPAATAPEASAVPAPPPAAVSQPVAESAAPAASEPAVAPTIVNETIASSTTVAETVQEAASEAAASEQTAAATAATETTAEAAAEAPAVPAVTQETVVQQAEATAEPAAEQVQGTATAPAAVETTDPAAEQTVEQVAEPAAEQAAPAVAEAAQQQAAATEETELPTVGGSQPATFGSDSGASRILIRATSPSWVEITDAGGKVLLNRLLRTGDTFRVPDQPGIKMVTGSAGGLEFTVDGKVAPKIGDVGDVRRDVLLEPDALLKAQ